MKNPPTGSRIVMGSRCKHDGDISIVVYMSATKEHNQVDGEWYHSVEIRGASGYYSVTCKACGQQSRATPRGKSLSVWATRALGKASRSFLKESPQSVRHPTYGTIDDLLATIRDDVEHGYDLRMGLHGALLWFSSEYSRLKKEVSDG